MAKAMRITLLFSILSSILHLSLCLPVHVHLNEENGEVNVDKMVVNWVRTDSLFEDGRLAYGRRSDHSLSSDFLSWNMTLHSDPSTVYTATVPGTILGTLVDEGVFPNPYIDDNLKKIPDVAQTGPLNYSATFSTQFSLQLTDSFRFLQTQNTPTAPISKVFYDSFLPFSNNKKNNNDVDTSASNTIVTLHLRGISHSANVTLNGTPLTPRSKGIGRSEKIGTSQTVTVQGMFHRHQFDLTPYLSPSPLQSLSLSVIPPPFLGVVNGGQGGDHQIARNGPFAQFLAGWDWVRGTPDRNTGIWDRISISITSCISIEEVFVNAKMNGQLEVNVDAENRCQSSVTFDLQYTVTNTSQSNSLSNLTLTASQSGTFKFSVLSISNPQLWWPNGYGSQPLYLLLIQALLPQSQSQYKMNIQTSLVSDEYSVFFGIRETSHRLDSNTGGPIFSVNGVDIFIRGGNWIATDQMFRFASDAFRYDSEVRMHQQMGLNLIRVWGGGLAERPEFYDACDRYGLLVMQEFWMTGDNNGRWAGDYNWPDDHSHYIECVQDTILMLRNHPSLLFWCGGNELAPTSLNPPADISSAIQSALAQYDPYRFYIASSMGPDYPQNALAPSDGPYGIRNLIDFWKMDPGLGARTPFNPEAGSIGVPNVEALRAMFSSEAGALTHFPSINEDYGSVDPLWQWHQYIPYTSDSSGSSSNDKLYQYGTPSSIEDFAQQAQIVNYQQYKALLEGHNAAIWSWYTGFIIWKTQSPWPALRGVIYDYQLIPTASLFGLKEACQPIHIQLSLTSNGFTPVIINLQTAPLSAPLTALVDLYDVKGTLIHSYSFSVSSSIPPNSVYTLSSSQSIPFPSSSSQSVILLSSRLLSSSNVTLDSNLDWHSDPSQQIESRSELGQLKKGELINLKAEARYTAFSDHRQLQKVGKENGDRVIAGNEMMMRSNDENEKVLKESDTLISLTLTNPSAQFAFFIRIQLLSSSKTLVPSVFYSDNYVSLFSSQSTTITLSIPPYVTITTPLQISITGWNCEPLVIDVETLPTL